MKYFLLFVCFIYTLVTIAQNNCPQGYSERNVKCKGEISVQCVPNDYTCKLCWEIVWPPCSGKNSGGADFKNTYERCVEVGENQKSQKSTCPLWYNNKEYKIFFTDDKFCNSNLITPKKDFTSKVLSLYDAFGLSMANLADAIEKYRGYTGPALPELTQTTTEYLGIIQNSLKELKKLEDFKNNITDKVTADMEEQLKTFQDDYKNIQQAKTSYENNIQTIISSNPSWKKLPDGSFYKILTDGRYIFFDGKETIENVSAEIGKNKLLKHQQVKGVNIAR